MAATKGLNSDKSHWPTACRLGWGCGRQQGEDRAGRKIEDEKVDVTGFHMILYTVSGQTPTIFKVTGVELGWLGCLATTPPQRLFFGNLSPFETVLETLVTGG